MSQPPESSVRNQKLKSEGEIAGAAAHDQRTRATENADPDRLHLNEFLVGSATDNVPQLVMEKIGPQRIRKNAVLAVEMLLTASPNYFRPGDKSNYGAWDEGRLRPWVQASKDWFMKKFAGKVILAVLHLDEATPHIHLILVPLAGDKNLLSCRELFGGKTKLSKLQTSYASALEHLGIVRGVEGSSISNTQMKKFYQMVHSAMKPLPTIDLPRPQPARPQPEKPLMNISSSRKKYEDELELWNQENRDRQAYYQQLEKAYPNLEEVARQYQAKAGMVEAIESQLKELNRKSANLKSTLKAQGEHLEKHKDTPLPDVLIQMYGFTEIKSTMKGDPVRRFQSPDSSLLIEVSKPANWRETPSNGSGIGAITLVCQLEKMPPSQPWAAASLIERQFGKERALADVNLFFLHHLEQQFGKQVLQGVPVPHPAPQMTAKVKTYLVEELKISPAVADDTLSQQLLYMDELGYLVFPRPTGGFSRRSVNRNRLGKPDFRNDVMRDPEPYVLPGDSQDIVLIDDELEAIALKTLFPSRTVIAVNGCSFKRVHKYLKDANSIIVAFNLQTGNQIDEDLKNSLGEFGERKSITKVILPSDEISGCNSWIKSLQHSNGEKRINKSLAEKMDRDFNQDDIKQEGPKH